MERFKICPNPKCREVNKSSLPQCLKCHTNLMTVRAVLEDKIEEEMAKLNGKEDLTNSVKVEEAKIQAPSMVRVCEECNAENLPNARVCSACGEDISYVIAIPSAKKEESIEKQEVTESKQISIASLDGLSIHLFVPGVTVFGRECALAEYLSNKTFVSRKQAEIRYENNMLYIRNLSKTNPTFVNNKEVSSSEWQRLEDGDEIGLGGNLKGNLRQESAAYFIVRMGECM